MRQSILPSDLIQGLSVKDIQHFKIDACRDLYKEGLKDRILSTLEPQEVFLEFHVGAATFDEIEEYLASNSN